MASLNILIEQVRAFLIQSNDNKQRHEIYNQFINECKVNALSEDDFYKNVLKVAHKSIDWNYIEAYMQQVMEYEDKSENLRQLLILKEKYYRK